MKKRLMKNRRLKFPSKASEKGSILMSDEIDISAIKRSVIVKPGVQQKSKFKLENLLARMPTVG